MKALVVCCAWLLELGSQAQADPARELFDLEVLFAKPRIHSVVLSPAGDRVAYGLREDDHVSVWILQPESGARQKLFDARQVEGLAWATDGGGLFFEVGIRVGFISTGTVSTGTVSTGTVSTGTVSTGTVLAGTEGSSRGVSSRRASRPRFVARLDPLREQKLVGVDPSRPHHVLVTEKAGEGSYRLLRISAEGTAEVAFARDQAIGSLLLNGAGEPAFVTASDGKAVSILRLDAGQRHEQGQELLRCDLENACGLQTSRAEGGRLLFTGRYGGDLRRLLALDLETGAVTTVHEDPEGLADLASVVFDPTTGAPLMATYETDRVRSYGLRQDIERHLQVLKRRFGARDLHVEPRTGGPFWLVKEAGARVHHPRYHLYDLRKGTVIPLLEDARMQVASLPEELLAEKRFFTYEAQDGMSVHGFVSAPPWAEDLAALPVVVRVHGGPWNRVSPGFAPATQFLVNRGYIVFEPDFRASEGYGWAYLAAGRGEFGNGRVQQDILDGLDHVLEQGIGDPKKVVIMGHSFGGYATLEGLASHGDRFVAGIASAPPIDLVRSLSDLDDDARVADGILQKTVVFDLLVDREDPGALDELRRRSPEARVREIQRPLLIYAGGRDKRVDIVEVKHLASALKDQGGDVSLLVDDEAGHSFDRVLMQKVTLYLTERFLAHHLGGAAATVDDDRLQAYLDANLRLKGDSLAAALAAARPHSLLGTSPLGDGV